MDESWKLEAGLKEFKEAMADAPSWAVNFFKGNLVYVTLMVNISVDCDCCDNLQPPALKDIAILSSTDLVALDNACLDLLYKSTSLGKDAFK